MLTRPELMQDWRQRLCAAEEDVAQPYRLRWLYKMRARLYRFLLSCYGQADWRADEQSDIAGEETIADVSHGDTTTILDAPLHGKPAKTVGKIQSVLKSVTAAQNHPPQVGPLVNGITEDDWVIAVSERDELKMHGCEEVLAQAGIRTWLQKRELKVRHFDLERAVELIRRYRRHLLARPEYIDANPLPTPPKVPPKYGSSAFSIRMGVLVTMLAPIATIATGLFAQVIRPMIGLALYDSEHLAIILAMAYIGYLQLGCLWFVYEDWKRIRKERRDAKQMLERDNLAAPTPDQEALSK